MIELKLETQSRLAYWRAHWDVFLAHVCWTMRTRRVEEATRRRWRRRQTQTKKYEQSQLARECGQADTLLFLSLVTAFSMPLIVDYITILLLFACVCIALADVELIYHLVSLDTILSHFYYKAAGIASGTIHDLLILSLTANALFVCMRVW